MPGTESHPPPGPHAPCMRIKLLRLKHEWNAALHELNWGVDKGYLGSVDYVSQVQQINKETAKKFESLVGHYIPQLRLETAFAEALADGVQPASQPCSGRGRSRSPQRWGGVTNGAEPEAV